MVSSATNIFLNPQPYTFSTYFAKKFHQLPLWQRCLASCFLLPLAAYAIVKYYKFKQKDPTRLNALEKKTYLLAAKALNLSQETSHLNGLNLTLAGKIVVTPSGYTCVKLSAKEWKKLCEREKEKFPSLQPLLPPFGDKDRGAYVSFISEAEWQNLDALNQNLLKRHDGKITRLDCVQGWAKVNNSQEELHLLRLQSLNLQALRTSLGLPAKLQSQHGESMEFHLTLGVVK